VQRDCRGRLPLVYTQSQIAATVIKSAKNETHPGTPNSQRILELSANPAHEEVKARYKQLVKQYHPDVNKKPEAAKYMKRINQAYAIADGVILDDIVHMERKIERNREEYWRGCLTGST
jgi:hypothetical protein